MTKARRQALAIAAITLGVIAVDQAVKIAVKTHMYLWQRIRITDWFYLLFTENDGMAFGLQVVNKYCLTTFRLCLIPIIVYYIHRGLRGGMSWKLSVFTALVLGGAVGNVVDCLFYGLIFSSPQPPLVASLVPFGHGYGSFMLGRVVDMFYFPLLSWDWPTWLPLLGGSHAVFFSPVFNFADACISVSVVALLVLLRHKIIR